MVRNTMDLARKASGVIDIKYDIYTGNINDIVQGSSDVYSMILNGFRFGYMQGMKAAKAEMKRRCGMAKIPAELQNGTNSQRTAGTIMV